MNLLEVKQKLLNRKEFNTNDTRTRNKILNKIEEVKNNPELHEEQSGLLITTELELKEYIDIDDYKLGAWACEEHFDRFIGIRQKCYCVEIEGKCHPTVAGLPRYLAPIIDFDNFKRGFSTKGLELSDMIKLASSKGATLEEIEKIQHKLTYKYVDGGVLLVDTDFTIK